MASERNEKAMRIKLRDWVTVRDRGLGQVIGMRLAEGDRPMLFRVQLAGGRRRVVLVPKSELGKP